MRANPAMAQAARLFAARKADLWRSERRRRALGTRDLLHRLVPEADVDGMFAAGTLEEQVLRDAALDASIREAARVLGEEWARKIRTESAGTIAHCYGAVRLLRPDFVVETGCATGWTTALILLALEHNRRGRLVSIDLPPVTGVTNMNWTLPAGVPQGFVVPKELQGRWTLLSGDVKDHLPGILAESGGVDVFFHDSDHTYLHMMWEYATAWPHLRRGGLLISDDVSANVAFWDFALAVGAEPLLHDQNMNIACARKP